MAASLLRNRDLLILEHNPGPAAKIKISGGGRCNITNTSLSPSRYLGDPGFIEEVFRFFDNEELLRFLLKRGLEPVLRKEGHYFCKESSRELIDLFITSTSGVPIRYGAEVYEVKREPGGFCVKSSAGEFHSEKVLVSTGGLSYPSLGASAAGFEIAESFGHTVVPPRPALVGLTLQPEQFWMKELSGLSLPVSVRVGRREIAADMLFAHRGISGPAILNTSLYWNRGSITVDFLPSHRLKRLFKNQKKSAMSQIPLPRRFVKAFFEVMNLPDTPYGAMSEEQKQRLSLLKSYSFAPAGTFGYTKAEVTKGGVSTDEMDPRTMQSRLVEGLYFAGEVVDVTGEVGGYNFQWAFSSATVVAKSV
ncbi:NAD(FAD)-utilizing dehydrogenases [Hydrogenimonas sp.]|nr:NAD(FAD)-utilizing dehydrogenases [Hydrogenimonas sp.]